MRRIHLALMDHEGEDVARLDLDRAAFIDQRQIVGYLAFRQVASRSAQAFKSLSG